MWKPKLLTLCLLLMNMTSLWGQELRYNPNGKLKIAQFTDLHYIHGDKRSDPSIQCINQVLETEKPDLVVMTGDLIFGGDAETGFRELFKQIADHEIPFIITLGNHDEEFGKTRKEVIRIAQSIPGNLNHDEEGLSGAGNTILPILSKEGKTDRVLYFFDSHRENADKKVGGYDYIKFDQIAWYREKSAGFTATNGGQPVPSLAFFHIPLIEYRFAATSESSALIGTRKEPSCAPSINSGLFSSMKEMGDIQGVFVGHDHDNDYAALWQGILLAYGRYSGGGTVYFNLEDGNGARIIELTEGSAKFRTWIRLTSGKVLNEVNFPSTFLKK